MIYKGFRVNIHTTKAKEKNTMTKNYVETKAAALARDYNAYKRTGYKAACDDYKTALDNLLRVAKRHGIEVAYTTDNNGFITIC